MTALLRGGIVAYPTDTVYGLGASMKLTPAVRRVYQVKRRPRDMSLPLLVADAVQMSGIAAHVPPAAWQLARAFLPGALTLVLAASDTVPGIVTAGGTTVAVRIPDHPVPTALIRGIGAPLVGTSANLTGSPAPVTAAEARAQLGESVDMVVEGGPRGSGQASTIVDVTDDEPVVLREGAISQESVRRALTRAHEGD